MVSHRSGRLGRRPRRQGAVISSDSMFLRVSKAGIAMKQTQWSLRYFGPGKRFLGSADGNVAIIFAVALVPMVLVTLGVVQYTLAISAQTKLNAVADAAALQAVSNPA